MITGTCLLLDSGGRSGPLKALMRTIARQMMLKNLFAIAVMVNPLGAAAACKDVVDLSTELPATFTTQGKVVISYQYDLMTDKYSLAWKRGDSSDGPFGPFPLTMSCGTASLKWETDQFLVFERGCGTFCWYAKVFALVDGAPRYQRIERPLSFHAASNVIAYYRTQDVIQLRNLVSGFELSVETASRCSFFSGLCISDVSFDGNSLTYTWRQTGGHITVDLAPAIFER
jgi:hypothetical protein